MARLAGYGGSVLVGTVAQTGIREWTLDDITTVLDGRGFDDVGKPNPVMGAEDWSGSFRGPKDGAPIAKGSLIGLSLKESTATGQLHTGSAYITGRHFTVVVDGLVDYSYDFVGKGTLTVATA
ncbi:MAG: hypothetical protein A2Y59_06705 [Chloroflexi bacterium RBG_13_52_14]|nr:MAG: hypothetical protein A2Y59_06705 [Chloroflexi bacterium RBG_13_52_14]